MKLCKSGDVGQGMSERGTSVKRQLAGQFGATEGALRYRPEEVGGPPTTVGALKLGPESAEPLGGVAPTRRAPSATRLVSRSRFRSTSHATSGPGAILKAHGGQHRCQAGIDVHRGAQHSRQMAERQPVSARETAQPYGEL